MILIIATPWAKLSKILNMLEIIPSIIASNFSELKTKLSQLEGLVTWVELDIMDGIFVPNYTWPFSEVRQAPEDLNQIEGRLKLSAHLMVENPEQVIEDWLPVADRIMLHYEATSNLENIIERYGERADLGLVLELDTPVSEIGSYLNDVKVIQLMSIEQVGFSGEQFSDQVFAKIEELKLLKPDIQIVVDGGVNLDNGKFLAQAGVSGLVVGSGIWQAPNVAEAIAQFQKL